MEEAPPPYVKMANRIDLDIDLEAGHIINQQPTAQPAMAYGRRAQRLALPKPHIECTAPGGWVCDGCGKCECCAAKTCSCTADWGTTLVLLMVLVLFLLALWLLQKA